jgi:hypothetical protein
MGRQVYYYRNDQTKLSGAEVAKAAWQAGFRGQDWVKAVAIAGRESGWKPAIHGSDSPQANYTGDRGLWQINAINDAGLKSAGIISSPTDLFDPIVNARAAFYLYSRAGNKFSPAWSVGSGGWDGIGDPLTNTNIPAAQAAVDAANAAGVGSPVNYRPPSGSGDGAGGAPDSAGGVEIPFIDIPGWGTISDAGGAVMAFIGALMNPHTWVRIVQVIGGAVLLLLGIWSLAGKEVAAVATPMLSAAQAAKGA